MTVTTYINDREVTAHLEWEAPEPETGVFHGHWDIEDVRFADTGEDITVDIDTELRRLADEAAAAEDGLGGVLFSRR